MHLGQVSVLLMSKYGFSIIIMLLNCFLFLVAFFYFNCWSLIVSLCLFLYILGLSWRLSIEYASSESSIGSVCKAPVFGLLYSMIGELGAPKRNSAAGK